MLVRRLSGYSYRKKVSASLREIVGKNEFWVSLVTNNKTLANSRVYAVHSLTDELFIKLRFILDNAIKNNSYIITLSKDTTEKKQISKMKKKKII